MPLSIFFLIGLKIETELFRVTYVYPTGLAVLDSQTIASLVTRTSSLFHEDRPTSWPEALSERLFVLRRPVEVFSSSARRYPALLAFYMMHIATPGNEKPYKPLFIQS